MTVGIASLAMYDHPAQRAANDRLWAEIARILRARGVAGVPSDLERDRPLAEVWRAPDLLLAQTCGYPLTQGAGLPVRVIALPVYDVPGSAGARHASVFVVRADEAAAALAALRGRRAAINDRGSNTGMNLFRAEVAPLAGGAAFFAGVVVTGSHRASVEAVATGAADVAAIDAVTWAGLERFEGGLAAGLRVIGRSVESPTLPFVTAARTSVETVAALTIALAQVAADPGLAAVRAALFLTDIVPATATAFAGVQDLRREAERLGYPELA